MPTTLASYTYSPRPNTRRAATATPYDQTQRQPSRGKSPGKWGGLGAKVSGGEMNSGGKRRPGHK